MKKKTSGTTKKKTNGTTEEKEIELTHQDALDRQLLIDTGFAVATKTNSKGQPVDLTINMVGLVAAILRTLSSIQVTPTTGAEKSE